jgi:hypothetical protein
MDLAATEEVLSDTPGDELGVGRGRLGAALAIGDRAGNAPAETGPTWSLPPSSIHAIEPPPLPISTISNTGVWIG